MVKLDVGAGGERYLGWAKRQLMRLRDIRRNGLLSRLSKRFRVADATIDVVASEWGDLIRIRAVGLKGRAYPWHYSYATFVDTDPPIPAAAIPNATRVRGLSFVKPQFPVPQQGVFSHNLKGFATDWVNDVTAPADFVFTVGTLSGTLPVEAELAAPAPFVNTYPAPGTTSRQVPMAGSCLTGRKAIDDAHPERVASFSKSGTIAARQSHNLQPSCVMVWLQQGLDEAEEPVMESGFVGLPPIELGGGAVDYYYSAAFMPGVGNGFSDSNTDAAFLRFPAVDGYSWMIPVGVRLPAYNPYHGKIAVYLAYGLVESATVHTQDPPTFSVNRFDATGTSYLDVWEFNISTKEWSLLHRRTWPASFGFNLLTQTPGVAFELWANNGAMDNYPSADTFIHGSETLHATPTAGTERVYVEGSSPVTLYRNGTAWRDDLPGSGSNAPTVHLRDGGGAFVWSDTLYWQHEKGWSELSNTGWSTGVLLSHNSRFMWRQRLSGSWTYWKNGVMIFDEVAPADDTVLKAAYVDGFFEDHLYRWSVAKPNQFHATLVRVKDKGTPEEQDELLRGVFTLDLVDEVLVLTQVEEHPEEITITMQNTDDPPETGTATYFTRNVMLEGYHPGKP